MHWLPQTTVADAYGFIVHNIQMLHSTNGYVLMTTVGPATPLLSRVVIKQNIM